MNPLLSVTELRALLRAGEQELILLDASVPPVVPGFESLNPSAGDAPWRIIPGARRFDYDTRLCDPDATLPHMMPSASRFEDEARSLGINGSSILVVYDDVGVYASPRAWWMLRAMGHGRVAVLDGGLRAWIEAGGETESVGVLWREGSQPDGAAYPRGDFVAQPHDSAFVDSAAVLAALGDPGCAVLDARSRARFDAEAPEPRPGVRGGHMPGAQCLPFPTLLEDGRMKSRESLEALFSQYADREKRLVTSCGSGLTACVLTLGAALAGYTELSVYDGSWADWGSDETLPLA